jgi:hypothetical protein
MTASQDSIFVGRRVIASRQSGGSHEFLVDGSPSGQAQQGKPDADTWRTVAALKTEQHPGTSLVVRAIAAPSGASEYFDPNSATYKIWGVGGETRALITWTSSDGVYTDTQEIVFTPIAEPDPEGAEPIGAGAQWAQLQHLVATAVAPDGALSLPAEAAKWAEWPTVEIALDDRGGARVIHASVTETPAEHTVTDTETAVTLTGSSPQWETRRPQTEAPDGATFEEHRYGTRRLMDVAARQSKRTGPIVAQWSTYSERGAAVTDTAPPGVSTSSGTWVNLHPLATNTAWDPLEVGWDIIGTLRAPEHLHTRISGAGSIPVLIRLEAKFAVAGDAIAWVRFASSSRGWVDVELDQATIGDTWSEVRQRGWLEAAIASDDGYPILQAFVRSDGVETVSVRWFSVSYGDDAVGA